MGLAATETAGRSPDTEALYREHGAAVAKFCRSLLRERTEAEDATQQVFLSAHRALLNGAAPRDPLAWLLTVARNECYARFRQRAVAPLPSEEALALAGTTADAATHVLRAGELQSVWDEVGRMPPKQREAFLLREIRGLSYRQLAAELSLSPPSVRSLILRARTRLRRRLGDVVAGLGGAPWVQQLLRLGSGADGASPLPSAAKGAAVGIGTLALLGGGGLVARHASRTPAHALVRHRAHARPHHVAALAAVVVPSRPGHKQRARPDFLPASHESRDGFFRSGSHEGSDDRGRRPSGDGSSVSGRDGPGETAASTQPTTDGRDSGTSSSSGSVSSSSDGGSSSGSDGGTNTSGSGSSSDGGSGSTVTVTTSSSGSSDGGSGSSGPDSGTGSDGG